MSTPLPSTPTCPISPDPTHNVPAPGLSYVWLCGCIVLPSTSALATECKHLIAAQNLDAVDASGTMPSLEYLAQLLLQLAYLLLMVSLLSRSLYGTTPRSMLMLVRFLWSLIMMLFTPSPTGASMNGRTQPMNQGSLASTFMTSSGPPIPSAGIVQPLVASPLYAMLSTAYGGSRPTSLCALIPALNALILSSVIRFAILSPLVLSILYLLRAGSWRRSAGADRL